MAVGTGLEMVRVKGEWLSGDCKRVSTLAALSVIEKAITRVAVTVVCLQVAWRAMLLDRMTDCMKEERLDDGRTGVRMA